MAELSTKTIRNICLLGHGGSGKTSVAEAMLYCAGETERMGSTNDGNTVLDFDGEEKKRKYSVSLATASLMWKDIKINILDAPGFLDFEGELVQAIRVADAAVITVDGRAGAEVGTELAWEYAEKESLPRAFFVNKCDDPESDFERTFEQLRDTFGRNVCPTFVPVKSGTDMLFVNLIYMKVYSFDSKGSRTEHPMTDDINAQIEKYLEPLKEAIAMTSDELLEKYLNGEEITLNEMVLALHEGLIVGSIVPVFSGAAVRLWGIKGLMDTIADSFPRHTAKKEEKVQAEDSEKILIDPEGECAVFIFKTLVDQFGKMSIFKVMNGALKRDTVLKNKRTGTQEKFSHIYILKGSKQTEVNSLCCGDIGMISKLTSAATGDTFSASGDIEYRRMSFPTPYLRRAIVTAAKGDEDKISSAIQKLLDEDPTMKYENNAETKQMLISGIGDIHIDVITSKLKSRYGININLSEPKIAYRETIKKSVQAEGKHKKQSGGSGQYGHVKITFSHGEAEGLTFTQSVVGGSVPKGYYPAVEKGLLEAMQKGVLAGYPVVNLAADLFDGSYHPVDSNEISFKLAAKLAYKEGLPKANPVLLEPIGTLTVSVPKDMVGDIMGDLNKRRGHVMGMNPDEDRPGYTLVEAEAPESEMTDYTIALRAMSQGRGKYSFVFARYDEVPGSEAQKIIAASKSDKE
jgi:elongation factor G